MSKELRLSIEGTPENGQVLAYCAPDLCFVDMPTKKVQTKIVYSNTENKVDEDRLVPQGNLHKGQFLGTCQMVPSGETFPCWLETRWWDFGPWVSLLAVVLSVVAIILSRRRD